MTLKNIPKIKAIALFFLSLVCLSYGVRYYYLSYIKYSDLEVKLIQIHSQMDKDLSQESLKEMGHFGAGLTIRNSYDLWSETSELNKLFTKYGVDHPDDMSGMIMETYIRSKKGVPFNLDRLIRLNQGFYKAKDKHKYMKKFEKEYYRYKHYSEKNNNEK